MAVTDAYADVARYKAEIVKSSAADDDTILLQLTGVSRYMERASGLFFTKDDSAVARVYIGNGTASLRVDEIASTSGLAISIDEDDDGSFGDETALASTDYELWPLNSEKGAGPKPWDKIILPSWSIKGVWPAGFRVEVTAIYGWPAVPEIIVSACVQLTGILRLESPRATNSITEFNQVLGTSRTAQAIIADLMTVYATPGVA